MTNLVSVSYRRCSKPENQKYKTTFSHYFAHSFFRLVSLFKRFICRIKQVLVSKTKSETVFTVAHFELVGERKLNHKVLNRRQNILVSQH